MTSRASRSISSNVPPTVGTPGSVPEEFQPSEVDSAVSASLRRFDTLKVPNPSNFDGSDSDVARFVSACKLKIASSPGTSSELALAFIANLLVGDAAAWYLTSFPEDGTILDVFSNANEFLAEITRQFSNPAARQAAANELRRLRQQDGVQAFNVKFNSVARRTEYNDAALLDTWQHAIKPYLLKAMLPGNELHSLRAWQTAAIAMEESYNQFHDAPRSFSAHLAPHRSRPHHQQSSVVPTTTTRTLKERIDPIFKPLTPDEKQRRRTNNLCLYCAGADHVLDACPIRAARKQGNAPATSH